MVKTIKKDGENIEVRIHPFDIGGIIGVKEIEGKNILHIDFPYFLTSDEVSLMNISEEDYIKLLRDIIKVRKEQAGVLKVILKGKASWLGAIVIHVHSFHVGIMTDEEDAEDFGAKYLKDGKEDAKSKPKLRSILIKPGDDKVDHQLQMNRQQLKSLHNLLVDTYHEDMVGYNELREMFREKLQTEVPLPKKYKRL